MRYRSVCYVSGMKRCKAVNRLISTREAHSKMDVDVLLGLRNPSEDPRA